MVVTEFSIRSSQPLKILIIKKMGIVLTFVTHECEIIFVHTYVTYENVICPNLCYTQNMISKCVCTFYICKCEMSFSALLFFRIWTDAYQNVPKAERVRFTRFSDLDLGIASTDDK